MSGVSERQLPLLRHAEGPGSRGPNPDVSVVVPPIGATSTNYTRQRGEWLDHPRLMRDGRLITELLAIRNAIGARGRAWVLGHFNRPAVAELTLNLYAEVAGPPKG